MKRAIFIILLLSPVYAYAQECDCQKNLDSVKVFLEANYAGYKDKVSVHNQPEYIAHNHQYHSLAGRIKTIIQCVSLIDEWLTFFKDHHLSITYDFNLLPSNLKEQKVQYERVELLPDQLSELAARRRPNEIEGIYHTKDTTYRIAVVKNATITRDYVGVILSTKTKTWMAGEVKFELKRTPGGLYKVVWYDNRHNATFDKLDFSRSDPLRANGWLKENAPVADSPQKPAAVQQLLSEDQARKSFLYKKIDSSSAYVRIKSFNVSFYPTIDSILTANWQELLNTPFLVIDLRGNGGGGDICYRSIKQLVYTQPVKSTGADFLATPENVTNYISTIKAANLPTGEEKLYVQQVERADFVKQAYFNFSDDRIDTLPQVLSNPKRVAILINRGCASAAEQFLLEARQSAKVIIYGQPTMGALDYANVCSNLFPSISATLNYPTTRSRRIDAAQGIDNVGIQPDVPMTFQDADWLQYVLNDLKAR